MSDISKDEFLEALQGEDTLGAVIRAHIHIEMHLNEFIYCSVPAPREIENMRLEYYQKVHLAISLGLPIRLKKALLALGTLRNRFAHQVDASLSKSLMDNFYRCFEGTEKEVIQESYATTRNKLNQKKHPKLNKRSPEDRFILYAIALRAALLYESNQLQNPSSA